MLVFPVISLKGGITINYQIGSLCLYTLEIIWQKEEMCAF